MPSDMTALPRLTRAQARELRAVCATRATGQVADHLCVPRAYLVARRLLIWTGQTYDTTPHGRAWLAANPDGKA